MKFTTTCIYLSMSHSTTTFGTPYASDICVAIFSLSPDFGFFSRKCHSLSIAASAVVYWFFCRRHIRDLKSQPKNLFKSPSILTRFVLWIILKIPKGKWFAVEIFAIGQTFVACEQHSRKCLCHGIHSIKHSPKYCFRKWLTQHRMIRHWLRWVSTFGNWHSWKLWTLK